MEGWGIMYKNVTINYKGFDLVCSGTYHPEIKSKGFADPGEGAWFEFDEIELDGANILPFLDALELPWIVEAIEDNVLYKLT